MFDSGIIKFISLFAQLVLRNYIIDSKFSIKSNFKEYNSQNPSTYLYIRAY
jgi:hypothetical protein